MSATGPSLSVTSSASTSTVATSATWIAGYEWFIIDNTSELALDYFVQLGIMVGTTPTINTQIRAYLVGSYDLHRVNIKTFNI